MTTFRGVLAGSLAVALLVPAAHADADDARVLVRLETVEENGRTSFVTGRLIAIEAENYILATESPAHVVRLRREQVVRVEQGSRRSRRQGMGRGAAIGLAVGAISGALIGLGSGDDTCARPRDGDGFGLGGGCLLSFSAADKALLTGVFLGALGTTLGAAAGAVHPGHRWVPFGNPSRRVSLAVPTRGTGLGMAIRF
jgi:hypothetical protein